MLAALKNQGEDYSSFGLVINDVKVFISEMAYSRVTHVQREGNSAAYRLAQMGFGSSQEILWFEEPSNLLLDVLVEEGV